MISQWSDKLVLYREIVYNNVIPYNSVYQNLYAILNENLSNWITHRYQSTEIGQEEWLILAKQKHYAKWNKPGGEGKYYMISPLTGT